MLYPDPSPVRYIIADNHQLIREGIASLLSAVPHFTCAGTAANADDVLPLARQCRPDILLIGLRMPGRPVPGLLSDCRRIFPAMGRIVLSMYTQPLTIAEVISAGANAFVSKDSGSQHLIDTIRRVAAGEPDPSVSPPHGSRETLTPREREVLLRIAAGMTTREIGKNLSLSPRTVEMHRNRLLKKFERRKSIDLVRMALDSGILCMDELDSL